MERKAGENTEKYSIFNFENPYKWGISGGRNDQVAVKFRDLWAVVKINFDFGRFETFYPTKKPCKLSVFKPKVLFYREKSIEFECIQKSLFGKNYGKNGKNYGKNKRLNRQSFINKLTANEEKAMNSISNEINWDEYPDIITKDQLYKICHISKQTARRLLITGAIPCVYTGKKLDVFKLKNTMLSNT